MQRLFLCAALLLVLATVPAAGNTRTCFCELRTGRFTFSPLLMDVEDPVLSGVLVTCRRARLWCPAACYAAARTRLLAGGVGGVSPLTGAAGETACRALRRNVTADTVPQAHVYAIYRVSNCHDSGFHYLGRLCCWQYLIGGEPVFRFNEGCQCGPAPPCEDGHPTSSPSPRTTRPSPRTTRLSPRTTRPSPRTTRPSAIKSTQTFSAKTVLQNNTGELPTSTSRPAVAGTSNITANTVL